MYTHAISGPKLYQRALKLHLKRTSKQIIKTWKCGLYTHILLFLKLYKPNLSKWILFSAINFILYYVMLRAIWNIKQREQPN